MRLKHYDEKGNEKFLDVSFWSFFKFWFLGMLTYGGILVGIGLLAMYFLP